MRRLLAAHGLALRRSAGQNLVTDPNTVRRIVGAAGLRATDRVVEIGAGLGSLTLALAEEAGEVVAIEIDAGFVRALGEVVGGLPNVTVLHADALRVDLGDAVGGGPARLVANLPYNVATPLLFHALAEPAVSDAFVMVQREVGERWAAVAGDPAYGGVSLKLALLAHVELVMAIPRAVFQPPPNVDSVMVRVTRRADAPDRAAYARLASLVDAAFAQRRKTLRNALRAVVDSAALTAAAGAAGIDLGARAEILTVADLCRLDAALVARGAAPEVLPREES